MKVNSSPIYILINLENKKDKEILRQNKWGEINYKEQSEGFSTVTTGVRRNEQ